MKKFENGINPIAFYEDSHFWEGKESIWKKLNGSDIYSHNYGHGVIKGIDNKGYLEILFDSQVPVVKIFEKIAFKCGDLYNLKTSNDIMKFFNEEVLRLKEAEDKKRAEQAEFSRMEEVERKEFSELREKYCIYQWWDTRPKSLLHNILIKLESMELLSDTENIWLEENDLNNVLMSSLKKMIQSQEAELLIIKETLSKSKEKLERVEKAEKEKNDLLKKIELLKEKYSISESESLDLNSVLYKILLKIDCAGRLTESEIKWLNENQKYSLLAICYENNFKLENNAWDLVNASKYWRIAECADKAIQITNGFSTTDPKLMAALLTTRGGAFRDKGNLNSGEECALAAIKLMPKAYYAYNLMGGICFDKDKIDVGNGYFLKAIELGSPATIVENEKRKHYKRKIEIVNFVSEVFPEEEIPF